MSILAAFMLVISSRVRVDKEHSLVEKSKHAKEEVVSCELVVDVKNSISECGNKSEIKLIYETTV